MNQQTHWWPAAWLACLIAIVGCSQNAGHESTQNSSRDAPSAAVDSTEKTPVAGTPPTKITPAQGMQPVESAQAGGDAGSQAGVAQIPATPWTNKAAPANTEDNNQRAPMLEPGTMAPDFVSTNLAGDEVRLTDFRDQVVVLDFWATWCGPCLAALPHTQEVARRCQGQGVVVLATCTSDTREKFEQFVSGNQDKYPDISFSCDPNERDSPTFDERASRKLYGVTGIPAQFVIGRDGRIATVITGYDKDENKLEDALTELGVKLAPPISSRPSN